MVYQVINDDRYEEIISVRKIHNYGISLTEIVEKDSNKGGRITLMLGSQNETLYEFKYQLESKI